MKKGPETRESRVRRPGNLEWDDARPGWPGRPGPVWPAQSPIRHRARSCSDKREVLFRQLKNLSTYRNGFPVLRISTKVRPESVTVLYIQYTNIRSISIMKVHFFMQITWFLARIDQQAESYHSVSSKHFSNIRSILIIQLHFSQRKNVIFR